MNGVLEIVESRLPHVLEQRPIYWAALAEACTAAPPPYGEHWYGELFRESAFDLDWLAQIIVLNARKEADGARQLWDFAKRIADASIRERVRSHAIDEARHSAFYIAMLKLMFPEALSDEQEQFLREYVPKFDRQDAELADGLASRHEILDEIVQMNIGEIRTLVNQMLMRPLVDILTPEENRERALKLIDGLGDDEVAHIGYTADVIDELGEGEATRYYMNARLREFNDITHRELRGSNGAAPIFE